MTERKKKGGGSQVLLFFLIVIILAAAALLLIPVYRDYQKKQQALAELTVRYNRLKQKSAELNAEVSGLQKDPKAVEKVAREKYGLVKPGETVLKYKPPKEEKE